ncbi:hypothetical protein CEUSTIGMA_g13212.t1 [Chlamydomonas eustigma]|uniref:Rab-GAP TBC domain-containing protein n=1 Tax=Chlamydomonas eustigma TaxID=1157962 RepID=A0A250XRT3_9CHLO|nr:hypothetical protein CEUSTIGMA_g13212.t1 [Chlamydomonas eustigma]|eukprot:GAX85797.1 hypothetical protein CEUSTIGMA_g13212.t1 [Chlamydomonas eustigma]
MAALRDSLGFLLPPASTTDGAFRTAPLSLTNAQQLKDKWAGKLLVPQEVVTAGEFACKAAPQGTSDISEIKNMIRNGGLPAELRPVTWFWLSGGFSLQRSVPPGHYKTLSSCASDVDDTTSSNIENGVLALHNTFKRHIWLTTPKGAEALTRIMYAVVKYSDAIHYSRSLHQLAAFLLVIMGLGHEEQAFWVLIGLVQNKLYPATQGQGQVRRLVKLYPATQGQVRCLAKLYPATQGQVALGSLVEQGVLERLVAKKMPHLTTHLPKITAVTTNWFAVAFTSHLPPETCMRAWDSIMCEGSKVLHRVSLAVLKRFETVIVGSSQPQLMLKILDMRMSKLTDSEELMQEAFNNIGGMPSSRLATYRREVAESPDFARQAAVHMTASSMLKLEQEPAPLVPIMPPSTSRVAASLKAFMASSFRSKSNSGSVTGSETGYSSNDDKGTDSGTLPQRIKTGRTASGRRVTISDSVETLILGSSNSVNGSSP